MFFSILVGKIIYFISKNFHIGNGSTWPGHIVLNIDKKFIEKILKKNPHLKIILVAGTNGKTTTVSLISFTLEKLGYKVFYNEEGANLLNGIASTFVKKINIFGKVNYDFAVFEVDEFSLPLIIEKINNLYVIVILNLFRDQLDRYGEVNTIGLRWFNSFEKIKDRTFFIVNGDDPFLYYQSKKNLKKVAFFGIEKKLMKKEKLSSDIDFNYCPQCLNILSYKKISFSHLGDYYCQICGFKRNNLLIDDFKNQNINYPLYGIYNIYNTNAVLLLLKKLFGLKNNFSKIFKNFTPAFGRQEKIVYKERVFYLFLSKNPAGFNQSLETIKNILKRKKANFLFILNNRIPDGLDISWIWDIDIELIFKNIKKIYVSGDRVYDMALRFKYEGIKTKVFEKFEKAVGDIIKKTKKNEKIYVLPTYSAMLELRKFLIGKKFL